MPASDALIVFGLLATVALMSLAAGLVAGLLYSIPRNNRTSAWRDPSEAGADDGREEALRVTTPSVAGREGREQAAR